MSSLHLNFNLTEKTHDLNTPNTFFMSASDQDHLISSQWNKISEAGNRAIQALKEAFQKYSSETPYAGISLSLDGWRIIYLNANHLNSNLPKIQPPPSQPISLQGALINISDQQLINRLSEIYKDPVKTKSEKQLLKRFLQKFTSDIEDLSIPRTALVKKITQLENQQKSLFEEISQLSSGYSPEKQQQLLRKVEAQAAVLEELQSSRESLEKIEILLKPCFESFFNLETSNVKNNLEAFRQEISEELRAFDEQASEYAVAKHCFEEALIHQANAAEAQVDVETAEKLTSSLKDKLLFAVTQYNGALEKIKGSFKSLGLNFPKKIDLATVKNTCAIYTQG